MSTQGRFGRRSEEDFSDEIRAHLALETDRLIAEGLDPKRAALEARRRFGNVTLAQDDYHRRRAIPVIEAAATHLRRAARRLLRAPTFAVTAALTLMLGIGATTAVFSLVNAVLLRPLPFADPARLVDLSHTLIVRGVLNVDQSDASFLYYRAENRVFTGMGVYQALPLNFAAHAGGDAQGAERMAGAKASAGLFAVLGATPLRGRVFEEREDRAGVPPVVIIAERVWRSRFASDDGIVGKDILVDGIPHRVVGVMPDEFRFPGEATEIWLPIGIDPAHTASATFPFKGVARLKDGVTPQAAAAELTRLLPRLPEAYPGRLTAQAIATTHMEAVVRPLRDTIVGDARRALWVVLGAAAFLLLVACANVANLFLVRAEERQHDVVVRRMLGAGRATIAAEFLSEACILAACGGLLGVALASAGIGALKSLHAGVAIPRLEGVGISAPVFAVALGATLIAAFSMSVLPLLRGSAPDLGMAFVRAGRAVTAGRERHLARRAFVVTQIALALVLVAGAGLMARSFRALRSVPPGFDAAAMAYRIALPAGAYPTTADGALFVQRALDDIRALPGVTAAGVLSKLPLEDEARRDTAVFVEDRPLDPGVMPRIHQVVYASPGAFDALGIPLLEGRDFERPDAAQAPLEVVVTRALARRYWEDSSAIGRRFRVAPRGPLYTIIGVTGDIRTRLDQPPDETVFLPLITAPGNATATGGAGPVRWLPREIAIVARGGDAASIGRVLRDLAPMAPVYGARSMREVLARATARTTFTLQLLGIASAAALIIGAVGLYGVMSFLVSLRAREMAVRIALGARPASLRWAVMRQAALVSLLGIGVGVAASAALMRSLASLLFDVAPMDPVALLGAVGLLSLVAAAASWLPARRAAAVDPAEVLRSE